MSNEIATTEENTLAVPDDNLLAGTEPSRYSTDKALAAATKVGDWLPYIQLMGGESKPVKKGEFPIGHFGLVRGRNVTDLSEEFAAGFFAWRPKAMVFGPPPTSFFDPESEEFQDCLTKAEDKNIKGGFGHGVEFLVWLPEQKCFAGYFMGNATGRNEAPNLVAIVDSKKWFATQTAHLIEKGTNIWHGPRTAFYDLVIDMPEKAQLVEEVNKFNNPPAKIEPEKDENAPEGAVETAAEGESRR
jgi:hypothetical protein